MTVKHYSDGWQYQDCWQDGEKHYPCAIHRIEILDAKLEEALAALRGLVGYFKSGNQIPVERATLRTESAEVQRIFDVLRHNQEIT